MRYILLFLVAIVALAIVLYVWNDVLPGIFDATHFGY